MKTLNYIIIEVEKEYLNKKDGFIINSSIETISNINRIGKVLASPENTIINKGDYILVHHNIIRKKNDTRGSEVYSNYHIKDNLYFVPLNLVFMYKTNEKWSSLDPYCFVKPIEYKLRNKEIFQIGKTEMSYKGNVKNMGILSYPNKVLLNQGLNHGDLVLFDDDSEYEFEINNEIYYKMSTNDIIMRI